MGVKKVIPRQERRTHGFQNEGGLKKFSLQKPEGYWEEKEPEWDRETLEWIDFLYGPRFVATNWWAIILSDLGLTMREPGIRKISDLYFNKKLQLGSPVNIFNEEMCIVGNAARVLTRFGFGDDHRVRKLYDRLLEDQKEDDGWHCYRSERGTLDSWEPLGDYAALPKQKRTRSIKSSIERGAEFCLERKLFKEGKRYAPWFRFHYPVHYFYDILRVTA